MTIVDPKVPQGLLAVIKRLINKLPHSIGGQYRFRIRGLDNEYGVTMINGIAMNKLYDGRPQWSNWVV